MNERWRIYAEDFRRNFLPSVGTIAAYAAPTGPGVRVDSGIRSGNPVSMYYDPLLCKIVVWDRDRERAIARMQRALQELTVSGVTTTRELHLLVLGTREFHAGHLHTRILEHEWLPRFREEAKSGEAV
jgi:acetyl-CoA carboxylase biotin carboxylase subunit